LDFVIIKLGNQSKASLDFGMMEIYHSLLYSFFVLDAAA